MPQRILELRAARKWSRERLGRESGLSSQTIWNIEKGKTEASTASLRAIASAFGVPFTALFPNEAA